MPFNGSGSFSPPGSDYPAVSGALATAAHRNAVDADFATGLSTCLTKDGQQTVTANLPMSGFKFTGMGSGSARSDSATLANVQDGTVTYVATVGGTADVITLTPSPAITAYTAGQTFRFLASGANTTNVTVNVSGLGAKALTKGGSTALVAGDIPSGSMVVMTYDGTQFQLAQIGRAFLPITGGTLTGNLLFTDATYDVGASGATRPRDLFLSRNAVIGGTLNVTGVPTIPTAAADTNTTQAASTAFVLAQAATQAELETGSSTTKFVTAGRAQYHPSSVKVFCNANFAASIGASYNTTSVTDNGAGDATVNFTTAFSSVNYAVLVTPETQTVTPSVRVHTTTASSVRVQFQDSSTGTLTDCTEFHLIALGDQ